MSTPEHPHLLRREIARGAGGEYVAARYAQMRCDGAMGRCKLPPERAPRLVVPAAPGIVLTTDGEKPLPARAVWLLGAAPKPLRMMTTLHYCRRHQPEITPATLLVDKVKADFERAAKQKWSHEYRLDFASAYIDWILVTTPEYRAFLETIEIGRKSFGGIPLL